MKHAIKAFLLEIAPWSFWQLARFEWRMWKLRRQQSRLKSKFQSLRNVLVNLGAGTTGLPTWFNIDASEAPGINMEWDCRKHLPLPDNCARGIFTEHFLEHLDFEQAVPLILSECFRILVPGGTVRIIVPDAGRYLNAYSAEDANSVYELRGIGSEGLDPYFKTPIRTKMELINLVFRQSGEHQFAYDVETLSLCLSEAGFVEIGAVEFGRSRQAELIIDTPSRAHESLYIEATKPLTSH